MTLEDDAALLGGMVWCERRGFELLGGWTKGIADPRAKAMVDRHAAHHAWRADQLWDRLPVLAQIERADLIHAPAGPTGPMLGVLAGMSTEYARLAGAYRVVLPRLAAAYRRRLAAANPITDGPVVRTLEMLVTDIEADRREGEDRLHDLLDTPTATYAAGYAVARLEAILIGASPGVTGP